MHVAERICEVQKRHTFTREGGKLDADIYRHSRSAHAAFCSHDDDQAVERKNGLSRRCLRMKRKRTSSSRRTPARVSARKSCTPAAHRFRARAGDWVGTAAEQATSLDRLAARILRESVQPSCEIGRPDRARDPSKTTSGNESTGSGSFLSAGTAHCLTRTDQASFAAELASNCAELAGSPLAIATVSINRSFRFLLRSNSPNSYPVFTIVLLGNSATRSRYRARPEVARRAGQPAPDERESDISTLVRAALCRPAEDG